MSFCRMSAGAELISCKIHVEFLRSATKTEFPRLELSKTIVTSVYSEKTNRLACGLVRRAVILSTGTS